MGTEKKNDAYSTTSVGRSMHTSHIRNSTRISHSGQGWYIVGRHTHLTFRSKLVHRSAHTSHIQVRAGASHIYVRAGTSVGTHISHSEQHTYLTFRSGMVHHRSAHASNIQVKAGTSVSTGTSHSGKAWYICRHTHLASHIQVRAGTLVGTHISHSGQPQGWYIGQHTRLFWCPFSGGGSRGEKDISFSMPPPHAKIINDRPLSNHDWHDSKWVISYSRP